MILKKFINSIASPNTKIQWGELNLVYPEKITDFEKVAAHSQEDKNLYFLGGVNPLLEGRAKDSDILEKSYIAFDFDLRKKFVELTTEELKNECRAMCEWLVNSNGPLKNVLAGVFSGNGWHLYYRLPLITDFKNWKLAYSNLCDLLEKELGYEPDRACSNLARILRLPLSKNAKKLPSIQTEFLYFNESAPALFDLEKYLKLKPKKQKEFKNNPLKEIPLDKVTPRAMRQLDNKTMLQKMSGKEIVNNEVYSFRKRQKGEYIDVNGSPADAWIDERGLIGSGKEGGPTWYDWLKYFGRTEQQIFDFLIQEEVIKPPLITGNKLTESVLAAVERMKIKFTWGVPVMDRVLTPIFINNYLVLLGESGAGKTAFAFHQALQNARMGVKVLYLSFEMRPDMLFMRYACSVAGITFREDLTGDDLSRVRQIIEQIPERLVVNNAPIDGFTPLYLEKLITIGGFDLVFIDNFGYIEGVRGEGAREHIEIISKAISELVRRLPVTVIALHHFNKQASGKNEPRGFNAAMGSAKLEHDCDLMAQIWRDRDPDKERNGETMFLIGKDRMSLGSSNLLLIKYDHGQYANL